MRKIDTIIIHCSATRCDKPYTKQQLVADHKMRGFNGCGYHFYITRGGYIHSMRNIMMMGAHCAGHNKNSIGVCYEGGLDKTGLAADTRTPEQKAAIIRLLKELTIKYHIKRIAGHRDFSPDENGNGIVEPFEWIKLCPCFNAETEYKYLIG